MLISGLGLKIWRKRFLNNLNLGRIRGQKGEVLMPSKVDKMRLCRDDDRRSKLSETQVLEIKEMYSKGFTQKEIGLIYGVRQNTIGYIVSKKSRDTLRKYRQDNPPKRRTKEEQRIYQKELRKYKKEIFGKECEQIELSEHQTGESHRTEEQRTAAKG